MKKSETKQADPRPSRGVRIPESMRETLKEIAAEKCNSFNGIVNLAIKEFIERERGVRA